MVSIIYNVQYKTVLMITSVKMKLGNVLVILMSILIQGGRTQAPPELQCYSCMTGKPGSWADDRRPCGDFGPLTPLRTCPRGSACVKESGWDDGEWTVHECEYDIEFHHGRDGCWKHPLPPNGTDYCMHCRCSTDL